MDGDSNGSMGLSIVWIIKIHQFFMHYFDCSYMASAMLLLETCACTIAITIHSLMNIFINLCEAIVIYNTVVIALTMSQLTVLNAILQGHTIIATG